MRTPHQVAQHMLLQYRYSRKTAGDRIAEFIKDNPRGTPSWNYWIKVQKEIRKILAERDRKVY